MMKVYYAHCALSGLDESFSDYIAFCERTLEKDGNSETVRQKSKPTEASSELRYYIIKGMKDAARDEVSQLILTRDALSVVSEEIIPALNTVGEGFENKSVYLPELLMSAEAAGAAFEVIKASMPKVKTDNSKKIVIATVKGDIHDIGKNIVKLILENYGFAVSDLGRDVAPEVIVEAVLKLKAPIVGLSALMTTTVPKMEETIRLLKEKAPFCKIIVGGAVLNREYAEKIGADKYAKDAMAAVRYAEEIFG
jgi:5-methyltetrahydrofolate--homocysteine methyltransferase